MKGNHGEGALVHTLSKIYSFVDFYRNKVEFTYGDHLFSSNPRHVWVVCKYGEKWLLTRHEDRGIEFPGGKVEEGETPSDAAKREVFEETGGIVENLTYIGQYRVTGKQEVVVKNVYFATIDDLKPKQHYYETAGPLLLDEFPLNIRTNKEYSFIMKDDVLSYSLVWLENKKGL